MKLFSATMLATVLAIGTTHNLSAAEAPPRGRPPGIPTAPPSSAIVLQDGRQVEIAGNLLMIVLPNGRKTVAPPGTYVTRSGRVIAVQERGVIAQRGPTTLPSSTPSAGPTTTGRPVTTAVATPFRRPSATPVSRVPMPEPPTTPPTRIVKINPVKPVGIPEGDKTIPKLSPNTPPPASKAGDMPTFRVRPEGEHRLADIDNAIADVMMKNGVRGAALAIVEGTRLVYAKGYTWAPPGYPDVLPTTFFRQASVSKTFAAVAAYQLIEEGEKTGTFSMETKMQDVLKLKTPSGEEPADSRFGDITIRHLLDMTAGLDFGLIIRDVEATNAFGAKLPAKPAQLASYCASQKLAGTPGDKQIAGYSNGGMFMLSQVIAKSRGVSTFEQAITGSLLQPLAITRVRNSHSLFESQLPDEVEYHPLPLTFDASQGPKVPIPGQKKNKATPMAPSVMTPDQPEVVLGYGDWNMENLDGCGGLSAAVTVARFLAALSLRENNPILKDSTITELPEKNAAADSVDPILKNTHGYHGFDKVFPIDAENGTYWGDKGGDLQTSQNAIYFEREGFSYVICWNGLVPNSDAVFYPVFAQVLDAARNYDWGRTDLFPKYGMPSFNTTRKALKLKFKPNSAAWMDIKSTSIDPGKLPKKK